MPVPCDYDWHSGAGPRKNSRSRRQCAWGRVGSGLGSAALATGRGRNRGPRRPIWLRYAGSAVPDPDPRQRIRRIRSLSGHGLAVSLAAIVVMVVFGAGAHPLVAIGGLLLVTVVFAALVIDPDRALASAVVQPVLPPGREE